LRSALGLGIVVETMRIFERYHDLPAAVRGSVLTIGNFDGVHRGHQALLGQVRALARALDRPTAALLFEPHPRALFQPDKPHFTLTPLPRKLLLLERFGLDIAFVLPFDAAFAALTAQAFVECVLVAGLGVRHVVIGYDFRYGARRTGDPEALRRAGAEHGFGVSVVSQVGEAGEVFSSSAIRAELAQGDVGGAAEVMGHHWRVSGRVLGGAGRGTGLGFPTANLKLPRDVALGHGIYAVRIYMNGARFNGAAYLGTRPTFDDGDPVLELFLFDFDGNLYGREIEVEFIAFVRPDAKFASIEALKEQMRQDCARAEAILAAAPPTPPIAHP
jgi:riboflavin kinase / FMN adenylyltransferase